jgi:hypothetical protein
MWLAHSSSLLLLGRARNALTIFIVILMALLQGMTLPESVAIVLPIDPEEGEFGTREGRKIGFSGLIM